MPTVGVKELKTKAAEIVRRVEAGEAYLVTRRGKPAVVMLACPVDVEDLILAEVDEFVRMRAEARAEYKSGKTISWGDVNGATPRKAVAKKSGTAPPISRARKR